MGQHRKFTKFSLLEESTAGTTPASAMQLINLGSMPSFKRDRSLSKPDYVTAGDRTPYPLEVLSENGSLSIPSTPLQYRNLLQVHEGVYANDEVSVSAVSATTISVTSNIMNDTASGFGSLAVGDCYYITFGGAGPTDGIYGPVLLQSSANITFPAGQIANFSTGSTITIKAFNRLTDGEVFKTYSAEWEATKLTTYFENSTYAVPNSLAWSWSAGGNFATEEAAFICKKPTKATVTIGTGAATAAPTAAAMNAANRVGTLWLGEAATNLIAGAVVADWNFSIVNDNGFQDGVGATDFQVAVLGDITTTLSATMVLDNTTLAIIDEFQDNDTLWARWDVSDAQGNRMIWFNSAMKFGERDKGESNNIINQSITLTGHDPLKSSGDTHNIATMPMAALFYIAA